jgi:dTDP-L-rhamnose 4-epimerase
VAERVLITGGAGFIGTRIARHLVDAGFTVRILDVLLAQVHGDEPQLPDWLKRDCELIVGDIRDRSAVEAAVGDVDVVIHLAAETGTAQSMYAVERCVSVNAGGTATLLECLVPHARRVRKLVIASSRAVYGEGKYLCSLCGPVYPPSRRAEDLVAGRWDPPCPCCGAAITVAATDEESRMSPASIYGATKVSQELFACAFGPAFDLPVVILRYQNVYGAGQSLGNPYTGILTHFFSALRRGHAPRVFEDGRESRDFVHVDDVVQASVLAVSAQAGGVFNVGSGVSTSIFALAQAMCRSMGAPIEPVIVPEYRVGDIRHCVADLSRATSTLGYVPAVKLENGLSEFVVWAADQPPSGGSVTQANRELAALGLLRSAHAG